MDIKLRTRFFPRSLTNYAAFTFLICMIPITYWFEIFVVLPAIYPIASFWYFLHTISGTFLMVNITSNFVAAVLVDTSIKGRMLNNTTEEWHYCAVCESFVPPRTWHCPECDTCILKRDHHCLFTACCIGYYNYRYFLIFLIYLAIATIYATYFNFYFLWDIFDFSWYTLLKIVFPLAVFLFDSSSNQFYLLVFVANIAGIVFAGALLVYHVILIKNGQTTYESSNKISNYNLGWKENIIDILGERWYVTWIFPSIYSKLPHDGITWHTPKEWLSEGGKHK